MIAETGHFALILALGVAIVQIVLPLLGARVARSAACRRRRSRGADAVRPGRDRLPRADDAYVTSDFSVENVWRNSHSAKPLLYKISGVWGNHEGSMLLWVLILALFGAAVATFGTQPAAPAARPMCSPCRASIGVGLPALHRHSRPIPSCG